MVNSFKPISMILILDRVDIATNTLTDGVYFINIQTDRGILSKKVIIQR